MGLPSPYAICVYHAEGNHPSNYLRHSLYACEDVDILNNKSNMSFPINEIMSPMRQVVYAINCSDYYNTAMNQDNRASGSGFVKPLSMLNWTAISMTSESHREVSVWKRMSFS